MRFVSLSCRLGWTHQLMPRVRLQELGKLEPDHLIPPGVYTLDDIKATGIRQGTCPYFAVRRMVRLVARRWGASSP